MASITYRSVFIMDVLVFGMEERRRGETAAMSNCPRHGTNNNRIYLEPVTVAMLQRPASLNTQAPDHPG